MTAVESKMPRITLPQSPEAEKCVLGGVLLEGTAIEKVLEILAPDGSDFYHSPHRHIFKAMVSMYKKQEPIDFVILVSRFEGTEELYSVGGPAYLAELVEFTPTAANIVYYARTVKEKTIRRWLITQANEVIEGAYSEGTEISELIETAQKRFTAAELIGRKAFVNIDVLIRETYDEFEKLRDTARPFRGLSTGFDDLDVALGGIQKTDLLIVAGRPSMGKSSLCCQIATNLARDGKKVGYFSIEVGSRQFVRNILAAQARIETSRFRNVSFRPEEWNEITRVGADLLDTKFLIDDRSRTSQEIVRQVRRMYAEGGVDIVFVDHLQEVRSSSKSERRDLEVDMICGDLKALAKELDIPVVVVSQLSRKVEDRGGDCRPRLSDLRDSGSIEQKADVVMFVYREEYYKGQASKEPGVAEIIIAKHRNGPTGSIKLKWFEQHIRFDDLRG